MIRTTRDGAGASSFDVRRRRGVWQVVRDGAFYGDYPVRQSAIDAVQAAARLPPGRPAPAQIPHLR